MLFTTAADREEFFRRCEEFPDAVDFGAAMEHVRSTNLGIWGDEDALRRDAARIVALEVRRLEVGRLHHEGERLLDAKIIMWTEAFQSAFRQARAPNQEEITDLAHSIGVRAGNEALANCEVFGEPTPGRQYHGRGLAKAIRRELSR